MTTAVNRFGGALPAPNANPVCTPFPNEISPSFALNMPEKFRPIEPAVVVFPTQVVPVGTDNPLLDPVGTRPVLPGTIVKVVFF